MLNETVAKRIEENMSDEELDKLVADIEESLERLMIKINILNNEVSFFGDNIHRIEVEKDKLIEDINYVMSK